MATMLEKCPTEDQRSVVRLLWAKGLNANDINKKNVSCLRWCLSRKSVHNWVEKCPTMFNANRDTAQ
jgi:hypothetical protein